MKYTIQKYQEFAEKYLTYNSTLYPMKIDADIKLQKVIFELHKSNTDAMNSIKQLVLLKKVNDIYCLSRSMFESVVNMGLLVSGKIDGGAERFEDFQYVEDYKIYNKLRPIFPAFAYMLYKQDSVKKITEQNDKFKNKYKNYKNWCGLDIYNRTKLIDNTFPSTCSNSKFFEWLYYYFYSLSSSATHRSSNALKRSTVWLKSDDSNKYSNLVYPTSNMPNLVLASFFSLIFYLASIRFIGHILDRTEAESYYQKETTRIIPVKK